MAFGTVPGDRVFQNPLTPAQYFQLPLGTVQGVQPPGLVYPPHQQQPVAQVSTTAATASTAQQPSSVPSGSATPATAVAPANPQDASGKDTPAPPALPGKADLGVTYQCNLLDSLVPLKVKEKIWKKEFFNLSTLLREEGKATSLEVEDKEESPQFQFVHKSNKEITTHRRCTKAFLVFISAHKRKFPEELPGLLIHMNAVNKLAWEQRDWLAYDTDFRTFVTNGAAHYGQLDLQLMWNTDPSPVMSCEEQPWDIQQQRSKPRDIQQQGSTQGVKNT